MIFFKPSVKKSRNNQKAIDMNIKKNCSSNIPNPRYLVSDKLPNDNTQGYVYKPNFFKYAVEYVQ